MAAAKKAEPPAWVQGLFVEDLYAPKILYAVIIRSPADRGTLISLDIPSLPRDYFSFLPSEIPGENRLRLFSRSMALLSDREIGHRGQPLALLAGPDLKVVKYFAQQIGFTIEKKTPLSSGDREEENQKILESYITEGVV